MWSAYGPRILSGVVDFMREHELWQLATENNSYGEMEDVTLDKGWAGDGLILFRATEEELQTFRSRGQAVVLTSTEGPDLGFPRVVPDNAAIGRMAAEHLVESAVPHFAFLARGETFYREAQFASGLRRYARERLGGFRAKLAEFALEPTVHYLRGRPLWKEQTWREVQTEASAFLDRLPKPCGLFVVDDSLAAVVLRAADQLGLRIPEDLAVIGFGDDPGYCFATYPALSSIPYPGREIGRMAADILWRQMNGETSLPPRSEAGVQEVITRESSDTLAIADPAIRDLVRHIRLTAPHDPIRVSELTERCSLSMTTIKDRFSAVLGHGPKQEIQRVRLRHLTRLLADPSLTLTTIARDMNFGSSHELSRFFLAETGRRPSDYRDSLAHADANSQAPSARRVRAVIFDMDGTLFDTEPLYFEAYRHALHQQGHAFDRGEYFQDFAGTTNASIETKLATRFGDGFSLEDFRVTWQTHWKSLVASQPLEPLPGILDTLELLAEAGIPVAIASSSDREDITLSLESSDLTQWFPQVTSGDEVAHGKPAPDIFLLAAKRLGVEPAHCLAIEDSLHGMRAAHAAGMHVIWVSHHPDTEPEGVLKIASLSELDRARWAGWIGG